MTRTAILLASLCLVACASAAPRTAAPVATEAPLMPGAQATRAQMTLSAAEIGVAQADEALQATAQQQALDIAREMADAALVVTAQSVAFAAGTATHEAVIGQMNIAATATEQAHQQHLNEMEVRHKRDNHLFWLAASVAFIVCVCGASWLSIRAVGDAKAERLHAEAEAIRLAELTQVHDWGVVVWHFPPFGPPQPQRHIWPQLENGHGKLTPYTVDGRAKPPLDLEPVAPSPEYALAKRQTLELLDKMIEFRIHHDDTDDPENKLPSSPALKRAGLEPSGRKFSLVMGYLGNVVRTYAGSRGTYIDGYSNVRQLRRAVRDDEVALVVSTPIAVESAH